MAAGETVVEIGEPGFGIDAVQTGSHQRGVHDRHAFTTAIGAEDQEDLPLDGDAAQSPLGDVVFDGEAATGDEPIQCRL